MATKRTDFFYTEEKDIHFIRPIDIIKEHPEVRNYIGKAHATIFIILLVVGLQCGMFWFIQDKPWWAVFVVAWVFGAFALHALFVMIHETAHNLIFQSKKNN